MERFFITLILAAMGVAVLIGLVTVISAGPQGIVTMAMILGGVAGAWWLFDRIFGGGRG